MVPLQISTGFASWQRYCTASSNGRQPNFAPPIFGRAAITLGIGPHSSLVIVWSFYCISPCYTVLRALMLGLVLRPQTSDLGFVFGGLGLGLGGSLGLVGQLFFFALVDVVKLLLSIA